MGLTTALYTGLSGINVNQARIDTIGNNIANVNTTAFKASRTLFQTQFFQTLSMGNAPSATSGGTNPRQVGLGAVVGGIQRNFSPGSIETTGIASDLAVEGNGFFVLQRPGGQQLYSRDGAFAVNTASRLVTIDGDYVMGFGVDENFNIIPGVLSQLDIPLGTLSLARATENVAMDGDLSAAGTIATQGSELVSQALVNGGGGAAGTGTLMSDLRSATDPGVPLFASGTVITVSGVTKGDRELPAQSFTVSQDGSTLGEFASWLESAFGIQTDAAVPGSPGVSIEGGTLVVRGNAGEQNAISISTNDFLSDNSAAPLPFTFTQTQEANGSGVFTAFTVFDSLGTPATVMMTFVLEATPNTGPVWRFYAESPETSGPSRALGTGTISFDTEGNFLSVTSEEILLDRSGTGAASPLAFTMDFSNIHGLSTQSSNVIIADQDGFPPGTLNNYSVGNDGTLNGTFTNGMTQVLGQVALAVFPNPTGLVADTDNAFLAGPNAGTPSITAPGQFGAGRILGGALELSNVDLSREFIGLITAGTGFQASSRVISISNDLLDQLLLVIR